MSAAPEPEAVPKQGGGKKKLVILAAAGLLLVGGGAGAWFSGLLPRLMGKSEAAEVGAAHEAAADAGHPAAPHGEGKADGKSEAKSETKGKEEKEGKDSKETKEAKEAKGGGLLGGPVFMELPDIIANLNAGPRRTVYVKVKVKLELARAEDQVALQAALPRVLDMFQGYLREMRPEELRGSAGTYRLREELLARTNLAAPPARATAVLFTEMIVQ